MIFASLFLTLALAPASAAGSSCIACHETLEGVAYVDHNFTDWKNSVHQRAGLSCEACHGGDPAKTDQVGAHAGVRPSTDRSSSVYFTRIPETCGRCHSSELAAFRKSAHYKELQRTGKGPNCATCHGSMANFVLAPRDLERTCTLCHRRPTQAYATLMSLNNLTGALRKLEAALKESSSARLDVAPQQKDCDEARQGYRATLEAWHTFDMPQVLKSSQELTKRVRTAQTELELKRQRQTRRGRP